MEDQNKKAPIAVICSRLLKDGKCHYGRSSLCPLNIGRIREGQNCYHSVDNKNKV